MRKIFQSMFNWRVKARWWAASLLLLAGLFVVAAALGMLTSGTAPKSSGAAFLIISGLLILIGSFGEEPGWRGFALPKLQQGRSAWKATLILSLFWWLWHIPFFFTLPYAIESAQQFGFIIAFGIQFLIVFALGILCAWVLQRQRRQCVNGCADAYQLELLASWFFGPTELRCWRCRCSYWQRLWLGSLPKGKLGLAAGRYNNCIQRSRTLKSKEDRKILTDILTGRAAFRKREDCIVTLLTVE